MVSEFRDLAELLRRPTESNYTVTSIKDDSAARDVQVRSLSLALAMRSQHLRVRMKCSGQV